MKTFREKNDGWGWVEYRAVVGPTIWFLEIRRLGPNGQPYSEEWYRCSDARLTDLQREHPGVIDQLLAG